MASKDQIPAMEKGGWSRTAKPKVKAKPTPKAKAATKAVVEPPAEAVVEDKVNDVPAVREEADAASVQVEAEAKPKRGRPARRRG